MKLIHISDLHLGKRLIEQSFIEDQKYILNELIKCVKAEEAEVLLIAGDIYDRAVPSAEAVELFDAFLTELSECGIAVLIVAGNHDSAERLAFAGGIMKHRNIYISPVYNGKIETVTLQDEYGPIHFYLLPYLRVSQIRRYHEEEINSSEEAFKLLIGELPLNTKERNVLIAHQFVTGAEQGGSEEFSIGGVDAIPASLFDHFDYTALGHIHKPQTMLGKIRYSGTPLKYSFSEVANQNGYSRVVLKEKGSLEVEHVPLVPLRQLKEIRGTFEELMHSADVYNREDYFHVILTDEEDVIDGAAKLRSIYPHMLKMDYDNTRTRSTAVYHNIEKIEEKTPLELFDDFYEMQNGKRMSEEQKDFFAKITEVEE